MSQLRKGLFLMITLIMKGDYGVENERVE